MWEVQVHGNPRKGRYEISVINTERCQPCQRHYGWHDANKIILSGDGAGKHPLPQLAEDLLINAAQQFADILNNREG